MDRVEAVDFFDVRTSAELLEQTAACLPEHRERLYPPTVTLSMFMKQVLESVSAPAGRQVSGIGFRVPAHDGWSWAGWTLVR